jgi:ATP-dependent RNA helicase DHX37/DHR1
LRAKSLEEVQSLRLQLTRLTNALAAARGGPRLLDERTATSFGGLPRPSPAQEALLRQLLLAGLLDRVARRLSPEEVAQASAAARSRGDEAAEAALRFPKRLGAVYESAWGDEPCFIHPSSAVAQRASPPDWIVFSERVTSSRCFLRGVTVIEADWLFRLGAHLCTVSQPLEAPAPRFDRATDAVRCWVRVTFGPRNWVLPLQDVAFPEGIERVRHFARLLLDGSVVQSLVALRPFLAARPSALLQAPKSERCKKLVAALEKRAVDSRARLAEALREDRAFLLPELRLWVQPQRHHALAEMWPPRELVGTAAQVRSRLG